MTHKPNLTIDDIARELGVSKTTVSRAISGKGRISAATREKVQAFIELHNYRPNASAKGLAESKTYNLALVLPKDFINLDLPFFRQSMSAICEEAFFHDYNILLCLSTNDQPVSLIRTLDYRKVDGVILSRTVENDSLIQILTSRGMPFATLGSLPARNHDAAVVESDHDQTGGCYALTMALLGNGQGKTALLGNDLSYIVNQSRLSGFRKACQELSLPLEQTPIRMGVGSVDICRNVVDELLRMGVKRFVCMDEDVCLRAYQALKEQGISIPQDVELASLSDCDQLLKTQPPITALRFDAAELGRITCRELLKALNGESYDPKPLLGYEIQLRESTR